MWSCDSDPCPPDELVATFQFSEITKSISDYSDVSKLIFIDSLANEIEFSVEEFTEYSFTNCLKVICHKEFVDTQCLNGEFENRLTILKNDSISIDIKAHWRDANHTTSEIYTNYAEFISFSIMKLGVDPMGGGFASNWLEADPTELRFQNNIATELPTIKLINKEYSNVFSFNNVIWFSEGYGLVGFQWDGILYELEEIIN